MNSHEKIMQAALLDALSGKGAHAATKNLFEGLDWKLAGARPEGAPHSIFQILGHMVFWQDWMAKWADGGNPPIPKHAAEGWPKDPAPTSKQEWIQAVKAFRHGLQGLERRSRRGNLSVQRGEDTRLGVLHHLASHNSHHGGQVVALRQILGAWPPPSGGVTW
jgi:uncharacterized damage-inducible protein DinB